MTDRPISLLIADDDVDLRECLATILKRMGYVVHQAGDGATALDAIANHEIDAIISDFKMPVLGGLGLLTAVRETDAHTPVIIVTGSIEVDETMLKSRGANYVIYKPFLAEDLSLIIQSAIRSARAPYAPERAG